MVRAVKSGGTGRGNDSCVQSLVRKHKGRYQLKERMLDN